jgi:formate/nitrite transporter FocA (FNT family)
MDYVTPKEMVNDAIELARKKAALPVPDLLIRGVLAGAFLGSLSGTAPARRIHHFSCRVCDAGLAGPGIGHG